MRVICYPSTENEKLHLISILEGTFPCGGKPILTQMWLEQWAENADDWETSIGIPVFEGKFSRGGKSKISPYTDGTKFSNDSLIKASTIIRNEKGQLS